MRKNTRLSTPAQFQCSHSGVWDRAVMYDENETYSWTLPSEPQKNPPFLNPLPSSFWSHGCSKVHVISHLWISYKCTLTLNTMIFSPSDPSHVWMALHYQANLVDDVTVGASLTLENQHSTKRQLQTIWCVCVCVCVWCGVCVVCVCVCVCVCVWFVVCVCGLWCVCGVCGVCGIWISSEQMRQQLQTVHYECMPMHTQAKDTVHKISLYVGLPRRQAVLIVFLILSFTQQSKKKTLRKLWRAETNIIKTAYLWCCATPSTLHTTRTWFWHTATCAVSRTKATITICAITSSCEPQYNAPHPDSSLDSGPAHASNTWRVITIWAPPTMHKLNRQCYLPADRR